MQLLIGAVQQQIDLGILVFLQKLHSKFVLFSLIELIGFSFEITSNY